MEYGGATLADAADFVVNEKLVEKGGSGGVIALDKYGNVAMPFNTAVKADGEVETFLYK